MKRSIVLASVAGAAALALGLLAVGCGDGLSGWFGGDPGEDDAPTITAHPSAQAAAETQTATFSVAATGPGTLTYQWRKDGADVVGGTGADTATYTTPAVGPADDGAVFTCVVTNANGSVESDPATLTVIPWDGNWRVDIDAPAGGDGYAWATAFRHPQYAVDAAELAGGGEVWVAEGTYERLGSDTVVLTMKDNVHIYGGFAGIGVGETARDQRDPKANETVLDGDDDGDLVGDVYHVVVGASNATLDGFTVTRGHADGIANPDERGGGLYASTAVNLSVADCVFSDNTADFRGGGAAIVFLGQVAFTRCRFVSNTAVNNDGGAVLAGQGGHTFTDCAFESNTCGRWGGAYRNEKGSPALLNCVFVSNTSGSAGGAVFNEQGSPVLLNCSFVGNVSATGTGYAVRSVDGCSAAVANSILKNGGTSEISNEVGSSCAVAYSNVQGGYVGTGNIGDQPEHDPLFVDPYDPNGPDDIWGTSDDGLRLRSGSPCIDAADTGAAPALDILGNARRDDCQTPDTGIGGPPVADMGAYEFQSTTAGLQVTSPNGGEVLTRGRDWTITWDQTGLGGDVKIEIGHMGTDPVTMPEGEWTGVTDTAGASCPSARLHHTAVWSGTRMIVWGGTDPGESNTGAIYDPATDTWESATSTGGANPTPRHGHSAVWTGTHMVVWGGDEGPINVNTGASYCLATDSWDSTTSTGAGCLGIRQLHSAVWTDTAMIVWGGNNSGGLNTGAKYDPIGDLWGSATSTSGQCPAARDEHSAVWSGTRMIVWGGYAVPVGNTDTGAVYDPVTNIWVSTTSTAGLCPTPRQGHSAAWTGSYMVVWDGSVLDNTGAIYNPKTDAWEYVVSAGAGVPSPRGGHTAIWTGTRMIVWGGTDGTELNTGAFYNPPGWHVLTVVAESAPDSGSFTVPASVTRDIWVGSEYRVRITHLGNGATDDSDADFAISAGGGPGVWHVNSHVAASGDGLTWLTAKKTVQEAVDAAEAAGGGEVWVQAGTYTNGAAVTDSVVVMAENVHLYGGFAGWESSRAERHLLPGRRDSVLDGENTAYHVVVGASNATLDGFTVTRGNANGVNPDDQGAGMRNAGVTGLAVANCSFSANAAAGSGGGMTNLGSFLSVVRCTFTTNSGSAGGAVHNSVASPSVRDCLFAGNEATTFDGGAVYNSASSSPVMENCVFTGNSATNDWGGAVSNYISSSPVMRNCTFAGNAAAGKGGAVSCTNNSFVAVTNCILRGNSATLGDPEITVGATSSCTASHSDVQGGYPGTGIIDADPLFVDPDGADDVPGNADDDFRLQAGSPCIDTGTVIGAPQADIEGNVRPSGGGVDMGAYERRAGTVYHVDDDRPDDTGDGLSWATAKRTIQAANALVIADAGDEVWVAEGTYTNGGGGSTATVLVMKNGTGYYGGFGGLGGENETDRSARDPKAHVTTLDGLDTAYHVVEGASRATLDGFTVTRGNAVGGLNEDYGAGFHVRGIAGSMTISTCRFVDNASQVGGGAFRSHTTSGTVTDCVFVSNSASGYGGAMHIDSSAPLLVSGCVFSGNSAPDGGAIVSHNSTFLLSNCTFALNNATGVGDAVDINGADTGAIANCILSDGGADELSVRGGATCAVTYSCVVGGYAGAGNIGGLPEHDPLFVDAAGGDLRLRAGSPCIDSADGDAAPSLDIDGKARHDDAGTPDTGVGPASGITFADMGAYEFQGSTLRVESPNGGPGEVLTRGQDWPITWNPTGEGGTVKIEIGHMGTDPATLPEGEWTGVTNDTDVLCPSGRCAHGAVWTGTHMVIWGGNGGSRLQNGGVYDPVCDSWVAATSTDGLCPSARDGFVAAWTGSRMVVWGGWTPAATNTGAVYDPALDMWVSSTPTDGFCLSARRCSSAVWTGTRMIVWGGEDAALRQDGAVYDPAAAVWESSTSTDGLCPSGRYAHSAAWTGSRMIAWGGHDGSLTSTGAVFDPSANTWTRTTSTAPPCPDPRYAHVAVWTGREMIAWGGEGFNTGSAYDPVSDSWLHAVSTSPPCPGNRQGPTAVWTGTRMIVWGGYDGGYYNTGAFYNPPGWHLLTVVADSTPDDGSFTVPASVTKDIWVGDEYRVRITHLLNNQTDDSDADFAISAGGGPGVWHVNSHVAASGDGLTWLTAMQTPQEAVDAAFASGGGEVWVQAGTYTNGALVTESVVVMADGVHLYGGFAGWESARTERVLLPGRRDSVLDGENTAYHVVVGASNATLDGFTVTRGNADGGPADVNGGGMSNTTVTGLTIADCAFTANNAANAGGAMWNDWIALPTIRRCTFEGNTAGVGGAIANASSSSPEIRDCVFTSNSSVIDAGALRNADGSSPSVTDCTFTLNGSVVGGAVHNSASWPVFTNCAFYQNTATTGGGAVSAGSTPNFTNCTFSGNAADQGGAIYYEGVSAATLTNCILWSDTATTAGNEIYNATGTCTVSYSNIGQVGGFTDDGGNINADPLFVGGGDYHLQAGSPCIDTGTAYQAPETDIEGTLRPQGGGVDMGAYERAAGNVLRVDCNAPGVTEDGAAWDTAYLTIQGANAVAVAGDEIWVADGTYTNNGGGTATVLVMKQGVGYFGGFSGHGAAEETERSQRDPGSYVTKLDGEDTAYHVVEGASNATLDGFTVTRGNAVGAAPGNAGGGINSTLDACLSIRNCFVSQCAAVETGGGAEIIDSKAWVVGCHVRNNSALHGAGITVGAAGGDVTIDCCTLDSNNASDKGGALVAELASLTVRRSVLRNNTAGTAGGAAAFARLTTILMTNCTLAGNAAGIQGHGLSSDGAGIGNTVSVVNCILSDSVPEIYVTSAGTCSVDYTLVQGGYAGPNIDADPLFQDAAAGDLRLSAGSPCIDAGEGDAAPSTDILGLARFDDPGTANTGVGATSGVTWADMGAYEFQGGLTVTSPGGGEILKRGEPWTVTWIPTGQGGNVKIEIGHIGTDPVTMPEGEWTGPTDTAGAFCPPPRIAHSVIWTGARMIAWGGWDGTQHLRTGAVYDPATDTWESATSTSGLCPPPRAHHSVVWTGSRMIEWGGGEQGGPARYDTGAVYDPTSDTWESATSTAGLCPSPRYGPSAVWTGARMIVWGGLLDSGFTYVKDGAIYDPAVDTWESVTSTVGLCPSQRQSHAAVWTGARMIVWGGHNGSWLNSGALYDPAADIWERSTSTSGSCPSARDTFCAVWTGSRMIVWGGDVDFSVFTDTGAIYDPATDTWETATSTGPGLPTARASRCGVWTGTRMLIWGGSGTNTGAFYNPPGWHVQAVVAESTPDDGSFTIPAEVTSTLSVGDEYRVRVIHLPTGARDDSDADFTIANLDIWSPRAGDVWAVDNAHEIRWQETWCADTLTLEFSTSGASGPWTEIATGVAASDGSYSWTPPPGAVSDSVCVRITSEQNPSFYAVSDSIALASAYKVVDLTTGEIEDRPYIPDLLGNDEYKTTKLVLKLIEPGAFHMGDESDPPVGDADELPVHYVRITEPYWTGVFELTQKQWETVTGSNPSFHTGFADSDRRPVEQVSWDDCQGCLTQLGALSGATFRLPTEAEWEYAAKAGTHTNYSYGDTANGAYMWYDANSGGETHEVGTKLPNPWELYDIHGNVWEWCDDWYDSGYYTVSPASDPAGPAPGSDRVERSGSWNHDGSLSRSACRGYDLPVSQRSEYGLRVVLDPQDVVTRGLVGWWKFDETTGISAGDSSGSGNDGALSGTTFEASSVPGKVGRALDLDGADDHMSTPDSASLDVTGELSISAWIRLDTLDNGKGTRQRQAIASKYDSAGNRAFEFGFNDYFDNWAPHKLFLTISSAAGSFAGGIYVSDDTLTADTWYHVVAVFSPGASTGFYVDGESAPGGFAYGSQASGIATNDLPLFVGKDHESDGTLDGSIDDVRIYDRAISPAEVQALYQAGQ